MKSVRTALLLGLAVILSGLITSTAYAQDPNQGKITYQEQVLQCQRCHGSTGEGLYARPLAGSEKTAQEWLDQVRNGGKFMPAFSAEQVSDQQILDMQAYFSGLAKPADFVAKQPPTAEDPGQNLMLQKRCVACHEQEATTGQGRLISSFIERGIIPEQEVVLKQLRTPFKNMPSYRPDQVSDDEAALIAKFLVAQVTAQTPPPALPQSGGETSSPMFPLVVLVAGSALALTGLALRRRLAR